MSGTGIKDQQFSMELELTGIAREQAAGSIAAVLGASPMSSGDDWIVQDENGNVWRISDAPEVFPQQTLPGSRCIPAGAGYRITLATPPLAYGEMGLLQQCLRQLRQDGGRTNKSCGLRVLIDSSAHNRQSLKNLLSMMYAKEDILFRALGIDEERAARWCRKVREPLLIKARKLPCEETRDLTRLESIWLEECPPDERNLYALDLSSVFTKGAVTFRCFRSTLAPSIAVAYIQFCLALSAQAITQRSAVMQKTGSENEKFTFRVWLVRLGLNGEEFRQTRDILLKNLEGDRSWRFEKMSYTPNKKKNHEYER